jgi:hypothetical protein
MAVCVKRLFNLGQIRLLSPAAAKLSSEYIPCFTIKYTKDDVLFLMNRNKPGKIIKFEEDTRQVFDYKYIDVDRGIYVYHKIDRPQLPLFDVTYFQRELRRKQNCELTRR